jgi:hypothetical protein
MRELLSGLPRPDATPSGCTCVRQLPRFLSGTISARWSDLIHSPLNAAPRPEFERCWFSKLEILVLPLRAGATGQPQLSRRRDPTSQTPPRRFPGRPRSAASAAWNRSALRNLR